MITEETTPTLVTGALERFFACAVLAAGIALALVAQFAEVAQLADTFARLLTGSMQTARLADG